jgi:hypothetical protein
MILLKEFNQKPTQILKVKFQYWVNFSRKHKIKIILILISK